MISTQTQLKIQINEMQSRLNFLATTDRQSFVNAQRIPSLLTFCGDTLDMSNPFIRERVEREFYSLLGNQGQIQLYFKRTGRYLPMIESQLLAAGLPDDLKFIAVHESALLPRIRSRSNAVGLWQFMYHTGRLYRLQIDKYIDERRDPEFATRAAIKFLSDLYNKFESWPLVLAAYNGGPGRIQRSLKKHDTNEFIALSLPEETERYYFKIVATKIILSDPEGFGYLFSDEDYFNIRSLLETEIKITGQQKSLTHIAELFDLDLIEFKEFNPHIINNFLPVGTYTVKVPEENFLSYHEKKSDRPLSSENGTGNNYSKQQRSDGNPLADPAIKDFCVIY